MPRYRRVLREQLTAIHKAKDWSEPEIAVQDGEVVVGELPDGLRTLFTWMQRHRSGIEKRMSAFFQQKPRAGFEDFPVRLKNASDRNLLVMGWFIYGVENLFGKQLGRTFCFRKGWKVTIPN